ncbi:MAG: tRNA pseudouridine(13) synthase TruD [Candidatus Diapherotrites archaeon]|nr:tRNA pseudouridine(13) synthase TruD [Candidatus Diapherotrites archaeon]
MHLPYSTQTEGTGGILKQRMADFQVEEISLDGSVCTIRAFSDSDKKELQKTWPAQETGKDYLHITLEKFNYDQHLAIKRVARWLQCSPTRFGFAGTKDKRAITAQRISIWKPNYERVQSFASRYIELYDALWSGQRIELGDLNGNRFNITIRGIELNEQETRMRILECMKQMQNGIPNYFGEQRFGGQRGITALVGEKLIRNDVKGAVLVYLTHPTPNEEETIAHARKDLAETNDFAHALKTTPFKYKYERALLSHLSKLPNDFAGAFNKLPRKLSMMFTHALQSKMFNEILAERLKQGIELHAVEGDVLENEMPTAPLFGCEVQFARGAPGEIEARVLEQNGLELKDFNVSQIARASSKGTRKTITLIPMEIQLIHIGLDEYSEGKTKAVVSFSLPKGAYATTVMREVMKNDF